MNKEQLEKEWELEQLEFLNTTSFHMGTECQELEELDKYYRDRISALDED